MGTVSKRRCVAGNGRWAERELQDGEQKLDLGLALDVLNRELGLGRLLLEGGGRSNGPSCGRA
jgi:hypothetical protein